ncbi:MAG: right-handed parallel beta-helix repeat-containing protein [Phycisphaerales bacterium]|nr:right-handed parallel beta-helix repeat-containing protein [Phycisphaerales bacterium]
MARALAALIAIALTAPLAAAQPILYINAGLTTGADDGSSWASAFRGPQALKRALDAAAPGSATQIWAAAGRYTPAPPAGPRRAAFNLKPGVSIYGGFAGGETSLDQRDPTAHITILSADLNGDDALDKQGDNTIHLVIADGVDASARIDGVTIRGGYAWGVDGGVGVSDTEGANILIRGGAPVFANCTISDSFAVDGAGAAILDNAAPLFSDCTFTRNTVQGLGGGAWISPGSSARFLRCAFLANRGGNGAGLFNGGIFPGGPVASAVVEDCSFIDNFGDIGLGAGPGAYDTSAAVFTDCTFRHNTTGAGGGGLFCDGSSTTINRCTFIDNEGSFDGGDAVYITGDASPVFTSCAFLAHSGPFSTRASGATIVIGSSTPSFTNCTFANNNLGGTFFGVGVIYSFGTTTDIRIDNCIFWNNRDRFGAGQSAAVFLEAGVHAFINHSLVQGWTGSLPGQASFAADPLFSDLDGPDGFAGTADDDLRLSPTSPAIDSADNTALRPAPGLDLAGAPRFIDDPATLDTGVGTSPLADRGALEFIPACRADLTGDGLADFSDYLEFLNLYDAADPRADFTFDGLIDFADYLDFINLYDAGC